MEHNILLYDRSLIKNKIFYFCSNRMNIKYPYEDIKIIIRIVNDLYSNLLRIITSEYRNLIPYFYQQLPKNKIVNFWSINKNINNITLIAKQDIFTNIKYMHYHGYDGYLTKKDYDFYYGIGNYYMVDDSWSMSTKIHYFHVTSNIRCRIENTYLRIAKSLKFIFPRFYRFTEYYRKKSVFG